jgi:nickel-type superoxide dismutase maturation protease
MTNELPDLTYSEFFLWILRRRKRFCVTGTSMQPLLQPGEEILINPHAYQKDLPQVNDLVVAIHPHRENLEIVKRVHYITEDGTFFLLGDNLSHSTDSRNFGTIPLKNIIGKVICRFG